MKNDTENNLIKDIRRTLDEAGSTLDGSTVSRLRRARHAALERGGRRHLPRRPALILAPVAGLALLLAVFLGIERTGPTPELSVFNEWQLITAEEPLEFYLEDLDFYEWLSEEMEKSGMDNSGYRPHAGAGYALRTGTGPTGNGTAGSGFDRIPRHI